MANAYFQTGHLLGVKLDRTSTTPEFAVGQTCRGNGNRSYIYVGPAAGAISAAAACTVTGAFAVNSTAGNYTADTALATGEYGWVRKTAGDV